MQKHIVVSPAPSAVNVATVVTPRGLQFWHVESATVPLVSLEFAMRGGAAQEPADKAGARHADDRTARRRRGRPRFAGLPAGAGREGGRDVVPLRPRSFERAHAHADEEPRPRRRTVAPRRQRAALRRGAVRARARTRQRAAAPRRQRSGLGRQPQLARQGVSRPPLWPAGRRDAREPRPRRAARSRFGRQAAAGARSAHDRGRRRDRRKERGEAGRPGVRRPAGEGRSDPGRRGGVRGAWARSTPSISTCRNRRSASAGRP